MSDGLRVSHEIFTTHFISCAAFTFHLHNYNHVSLYQYIKKSSVWGHLGFCMHGRCEITFVMFVQYEYLPGETVNRLIHAEIMWLVIMFSYSLAFSSTELCCLKVVSNLHWNSCTGNTKSWLNKSEHTPLFLWDWLQSSPHTPSCSNIHFF